MVLIPVGFPSHPSSLLLRSNHPIPNPSISKPSIRVMKMSCVGRQQTLPTNRLSHGPCEGSGRPRVFVLSDLHTDYSDNMEWVMGLSTVWYRNDILIVAGDVAETYKNFVLTMSELKARFDSVFYVPGNHDLWCRREGDRYVDSLEKLNTLLDACSELGVDTNPRIVDGLGIIPLSSWYHESFDKEKDITAVRIPPLHMARSLPREEDAFLPKPSEDHWLRLTGGQIKVHTWK